MDERLFGSRGSLLGRVLYALSLLAIVAVLLPAAALAEGDWTEVSDANALQSAVDGNSTNIKLTADINGSSLDSSSGDLDIRYELTIDLNGHTLSSNGASWGTIYLGSGTNLTIMDSSESQAGKVQNTANNGLAILVYDATLNVSGGTIEATTGAGAYAIYAGGKAKLTLSDDAKLTGQNGTTLQDNDNVATISGGSIDVEGTGIFIGRSDASDTKSTFAMTGGSIKANNIGVNVLDASQATISGGEISSQNYGVNALGTSQVTISGGVISAKNAAVNTGATRPKVSAAQVTITGGAINSSDGFGLTAADNSTVTVSGGSIAGTNMFETSENGQLYIKGGEWTGDFIAQNRYPEITGGVFTSRTGKMVGVNDPGKPEWDHYLEEYVQDNYALVDLNDTINSDKGTYAFGVGPVESLTLSIEPSAEIKYYDGNGVELVATPSLGKVTANGNTYEVVYPIDSVVTSFEWKKGDEIISGAMSSSYVTNPDICDETAYTCTVSLANKVMGEDDKIETASATAKITILKPFAVTFDTAGGSAVASQTIAGGSSVTRPADPTRSGYVFKGWQLNGADYDFSTPVTGDITLVATWEENSEPATPTPATPAPTPTPTAPTAPARTNAPAIRAAAALPATGDVALPAGAMVALGSALLAGGTLDRRRRGGKPCHMR